MQVSVATTTSSCVLEDSLARLRDFHEDKVIDLISLACSANICKYPNICKYGKYWRDSGAFLRTGWSLISLTCSANLAQNFLLTESSGLLQACLLALQKNTPQLFTKPCTTMHSIYMGVHTEAKFSLSPMSYNSLRFPPTSSSIQLQEHKKRNKLTDAITIIIWRCIPTSPNVLVSLLIEEGDVSSNVFCH